MLNQILREIANAGKNITQTANGAFAYVSTLSANLDFYAHAGNIGVNSLDSFKLAFEEDPSLALRNLLKNRDIRQGHGVRTGARSILKWLGETKVSVILQTNLLEQFVEVGRWDDIFVLLELNNSTINGKLVKLVAKELLKGKENSLVAKWLPLNSKVEVERKFISQLRSYMRLTPKELRKLVTQQRKDVVEVKMSAKNFSGVEYSHVPSQAFRLYSRAFKRNDPERFSDFIEKAAKGEVKVNAGATYPHEILRNVRSPDATVSTAAMAQWGNLPDFVKRDVSILPVVDVSGSMSTLAYGTYSCMEIAVGLGLYLAERNKSVFKDLVVTFSESPDILDISDCSNIQEKMNKVLRSDWGYNTDLEAVFQLLLQKAVEAKVEQKDLPEYIMVFTDMQYDGREAWDDKKANTVSLMAELRETYLKAGYILPKVVWWNLDVSMTNTPVLKDESGTSIVSGASPALLEAVLADNLDLYTPENVMLEDLMQDRYKVTLLE